MEKLHKLWKKKTGKWTRDNHFKTWGWREGLAVSSACCFSCGQESDDQHQIKQLTTSWSSSSTASNALFWLPCTIVGKMDNENWGTTEKIQRQLRRSMKNIGIKCHSWRVIKWLGSRALESERSELKNIHCFMLWESQQEPCKTSLCYMFA